MEQKVIDLRNYFIDKYGYGIVKIPNDNDNILIYNENYKYNLIRISNKDIPNNSNDKALINNIKNVLEQKLNREINILDIHINNQKVSDNLFYDTISIDINHYDGIDISNDYNDIKEFFKEEINVKETIIKEIKIKKNKKINNNKFKPILTNTILFICISLCILYNVLDIIESKLFSNHSVNALLLGAYYKENVVVLHEYYRLFTYGFLHLSFIHLATNMFSLNYLGSFIEKTYGRKKYLLILILSIIGSCLFVFYIEDNILLIGISGGIYGLLGAMLVYTYNLGLFNNPIYRIQILKLLILNLVISLLPNVSFVGHVGGLVTGTLVSSIMILDKNYHILKINTLITLIILKIFLLYSVYNTKHVVNAKPGVLLAYGHTLENMNFHNISYNIYYKVIHQYDLKEK